MVPKERSVKREHVMNIFLKRILGSSLLGLLGTVGIMQAGQHAKFHLPFPATWSGITLTPGDYTVTLPEGGKPQRQFFLVGQGLSVILPVTCTDFNENAFKTEDRSYLRVRNIDGKYYIESYVAGPASKEFDFVVPKSSHKLEIGKHPVEKLDVTGE